MKMKTAAAAAVVLVGGYLVATAFTSHKIAQANEDYLQQLEAKTSFLTVVDRKVEGNMFATTYSGKIRVNCKTVVDELAEPSQRRECKAIEIGYVNHVRTGPLPGMRFAAAVVDTQILPPEDAPDRLRKYLAQMNPQDIQTVVGYGGGYKTLARLPAGGDTTPEAQVSWAELRLELVGNSDKDKFSFDVSLPEASVSSEDEILGKRSLKLANVHWHGKAEPGANSWLRPGTSSFGIERVLLNDTYSDKPLVVQLDKLGIQSELAIDTQGYLNGSDHFTGNVSVRLGENAKPLEFTDFEYRQSIKHLESASVTKLVDLWWAATKRQMSKGSVEDVAFDATTTDDVLGAFKQILLNDPQFSIDKLAMTFRGKRGEASASASVPGLVAKDLESILELQAVLQTHFKAKFDAKVPVSWFEAAGELAGGTSDEAASKESAEMFALIAVKSGFASRDGDFLVSSGTREKGVSRINGKPFKSILGAEPETE